MSNLAFGQSSLSQEEYGMSGEQYITTPGGTVKIYVNICKIYANMCKYIHTYEKSIHICVNLGEIHAYLCEFR